METIETDYLIIGAGAVGLAFADTMLAESDASITIVDRHGKPGGHWNDAYGFVALHQPSEFYGVPSLPLGSGQIDRDGFNAGMHELASGTEVLHYLDRVMRRRLLPSGRVRYLPMTDHCGDGQVTSLLTGAETRVDVRRRIVDATYYGVSVPSTHVPKFRIGDGVRLVTPNALPHLWKTPDLRPSQFTIVGAGKTAMDSIVWLIANDVPPEAIRWIVPRDSWLLNRRCVQPGDDYFFDTIGGFAAQAEAAAVAHDAHDLFERFEAAGVAIRVDCTIQPQMYHYAIISEGEIEQLRRISDVVRLGRVEALEADRIILQQGVLPVLPGTLFVDCSASAALPRPIVPVFQDNRIVLQMLRTPLVTFNAALVAWVEANVDGDAARNALCTPSVFPDRIEDFPAAFLGNMINQVAWDQNPALKAWIGDCRLDAAARVVTAAIASGDPAKLSVLGRIGQAMMPAAANLQRLARR